jgi:serine/threonine protein kinase
MVLRPYWQCCPCRCTSGTPYYLSPEICNDQPYDRKSDVWALGCVLYELAALRRPFDAASLPALVVKILRGAYAPIPSRYSPALKSLVDGLLKQDPKACVQHAQHSSLRCSGMACCLPRPYVNYMPSSLHTKSHSALVSSLRLPGDLLHVQTALSVVQERLSVEAILKLEFVRGHLQRYASQLTANLPAPSAASSEAPAAEHWMPVSSRTAAAEPAPAPPAAAPIGVLMLRRLG